MNEPRGMSATAVTCFCTRNRRDDLIKAISTFLLHHSESSHILVVDSSDSTLSKDRDFSQFAQKIKNLTLITSEPGLTLQRNVALTWSVQAGFELIHFFDDDVTFESNYLSDIESFLESSPDYVGAGGGVISPGLKPVARPQFINRLLGRDGSVTKSGYNRPVGLPLQDCDVDWLPGCAMSYRIQAAANCRFDESRTGYGLGEDVDFSLRIRRFGKLRHITSVALTHHLSPVNRYKAAQIAQDSVLHRLALGFDFGGRVRPVNVVMSTLFELVATMAIGAVLARKDMLQRCAGLLAGLWRAGKEFLSMPSCPVYVLNGGLGNQLFILAAAMAESKERGTSVYLDVSAFSGKSLRELELSKFKLPNNIRILRRRALYGRYYDSFIQRLWNVILQFASKGKGLRIGYFQDKKYPEGLKSEILSLLRSAPVSEYWLSQISDQVKCVCHVRAGDYLLKQNQEFHGLLSRDYFIRGWQIISSSDGGNPPSSVGVICDSAAYLESLGLTFKHYSLEQDRALTAIEILAIMSRTPHLILSNSSLSWWGAFWADLEGVAANVVAPKDWYVDAEAGDIYLKSWHIVESKLNESDNP